MDTCFGPLIRFDVHDDDVDISFVALYECRGCGEIFITDPLGKLYVGGHAPLPSPLAN